MFLDQHVQRSKTSWSGIQNHQFFNFGELIIPYRSQELGHALVGLVLDVWSLFVEICFQLVLVEIEQGKELRVESFGGYLVRPFVCAVCVGLLLMKRFVGRLHGQKGTLLLLVAPRICVNGSEWGGEGRNLHPASGRQVSSVCESMDKFRSVQNHGTNQDRRSDFVDLRKLERHCIFGKWMRIVKALKFQDKTTNALLCSYSLTILQLKRGAVSHPFDWQSNARERTSVPIEWQSCTMGHPSVSRFHPLRTD